MHGAKGLARSALSWASRGRFFGSDNTMEVRFGWDRGALACPFPGATRFDGRQGERLASRKAA